MITIQFPDGSAAGYTLAVDRFNLLRIEQKGQAFDLLSVLRIAWRIIAADDEDRQRLEEFGVWGGRVQ